MDFLKAARNALFNGTPENNRSGSNQGDAEYELLADADDSIINQLAAITVSEQQSVQATNPSPRRHAAIASRKRNCNCVGKRK